MRAGLILLLAMGASTLPSAQASAPITHGPGPRQPAGNSSQGVSRPLAVSSPLAISQPVATAAQGSSDPTCAAGIHCETSIGFKVVPEHAAISLRKTADVTTFTAAGFVITYTFTVTNNGNVPLHNVTVVDSKVGTVSCPGSTLAVGTSMVCTARYTTTAADVATHEVANTATVTALSPSQMLSTATASKVIQVRPVPPVPPVSPTPTVSPVPSIPPVPSVPVVPAVPVTG
jgi:uncharacterized repeat protein (TIGR01451 family)